MADVVTTAAVLVVLWAYVQRGDQHYVSLAGSQWHWLWYAVPLMLLIEGLAWTLYVRFMPLDWREALGPAGDDGGNDADTNHEDDDRDEVMPPDHPPHRGDPTASSVPARLHVLLAAQASRAVILRRGPAKEVATFSWNLENDEIQLGQWLRGRIYERRGDLSPDGQFLLYFAMDGRWDGPAQGAYSAISRAPFLKALTLLPKGDWWPMAGG